MVLLVLNDPSRFKPDRASKGNTCVININTSPQKIVLVLFDNRRNNELHIRKNINCAFVGSGSVPGAATDRLTQNFRYIPIPFHAPCIIHHTL